jgi:hypothetical protein
MVLCKYCDKRITTWHISCTKCYIIHCENCLDKKTKELIKLLNDCRDTIVDKNSDLQFYLDIRNNGFENMKKEEIDETNHLIVYNKGVIHELKQIMFRYLMILNPRIQLTTIDYEFENAYQYYLCYNCKT